MLFRMGISSMYGSMYDSQCYKNVRTAGNVSRVPLKNVFFKYAVFFLIFILAGCRETFSQQTRSPEIEKAFELLNMRGEVIISFKIPGEADLHSFASVMSFDRVTSDSVTAYFNKYQFDRFLKLNIPFNVKHPPSLKVEKGIQEHEEKSVALTYPSYDEYISLMEKYAAEKPDLCRLVDIGRSAEGRKLLALKISDNPFIKEDEPVLFFTSTMHGDEVTGFVIMLQLIDELLGNYSTLPRIRNIVDNIEIWINPLANPDGTYFVSDQSVYGAKRFNSNNVDLNRNFPDPEFGDHPYNEEWQPETITMMDFMKENGINLAANFHGGSELVNFPWDTWPVKHADDGWYRIISRAYADTVHLLSPAVYMTDEDNGITMGYEWYEVHGGRQDYSNYYLNIREVTIEISEIKMPDETDLLHYWSYNRNSIYNFMELLFNGVSGKVTDAITGNPVVAGIFVEGHDKDNSHVVSDRHNGYYHRLILPGNYRLVYKSAGYKDYYLDLSVPGSGMLTADVRLEPVEGSIFYPNPYSDGISVYLTGTDAELFYEFYDLSGRLVKSGKQSFAGSGLQTIYAPELAKGTYIMKIRHDNEIFKHVVVKQ